jgi:hypothetical protein
MNLSEIFNGAGGGGLDAFDSTPPAPDGLVPPGVYDAVVIHGELMRTRSGNDGYRIRFRIVEGPHAGHLVFRTWSFSERALPYARRDLNALGLTSSAQLLAPFPPAGKEFRVKLWVALQRGDDGVERNDVKRVQVITTGPTTAPPAPPTAPPTAGPTTAGLPPELARFALRGGRGDANER